jgi:hypothetical protein
MSTIVKNPADERLRALRSHSAAGIPEMTQQERVIFMVYVVMGAAIVAFLAATTALWSLGV